MGFIGPSSTCAEPCGELTARSLSVCPLHDVAHTEANLQHRAHLLVLPMLCLDRGTAIAVHRSDEILTKPRVTNETPNLEQGISFRSSAVVLMVGQTFKLNPD